MVWPLPVGFCINLLLIDSSNRTFACPLVAYEVHSISFGISIESLKRCNLFYLETDKSPTQQESFFLSFHCNIDNLCLTLIVEAQLK